MWRSSLERALDTHYDLWRSGQQKSLTVSYKSLKNWIDHKHSPERHTLERLLNIQPGDELNILQGKPTAEQKTLTFPLKTTRSIYRAYLCEKIGENPMRFAPTELGTAEVSKTYSIETTVAELARQIQQTDYNHIVSLEGIGGSGKTTHAIAIVQHLKKPDDHALLAGKYPFDGILWMMVQNTVNEYNGDSIRRFVLGKIGDFIGVHMTSGEPLDNYRERILKALKQGNYLIVIDNIEQRAQLNAIIEDLHQLRFYARFIMTSRESLNEHHDAIDTYHVQDLEPYDAHALLQSRLKANQLSITYEQTEQIYQHTGGNPLALLLIAGLLLKGMPFNEVIESINGNQNKPLAGDLQETAEKMKALFQRIYQAIWQKLSISCRHLFIALADVPASGIYHADLEKYIQDVQQVYSDDSLDQYHHCLSILRGHYIIMRSGNVESLHYMMHELTRSFIKGAFNEKDEF